MKQITLPIILLIAAAPCLFAADKTDAPKQSWTKELKDPAKRGTLRDAYQYVRGDTGKWNDDPRLERVPPIKNKPPKMPLDDWAEAIREKPVHYKSGDDNWVIFHSKQLNDNDRLWVHRIERKGNTFTITAHEAAWQGEYRKNFTWHALIGINLGKLDAGDYEVKWIVQPFDFKRHEITEQAGRKQRGWPADEQAAKRKAKELTVTLRVPGE